MTTESALTLSRLYIDDDTGLLMLVGLDGVATPMGSGGGAGGDFDRMVLGSGNITTALTSWTDTGIEVNLDVAAGSRVQFGFVGSVESSTTTAYLGLDVAVDTVRQGTAFGLIQVKITPSTVRMNASFTDWTEPLSAGAHEFKLQWIISGGSGTVTMLAADADQRPILWAKEHA